MNALRFVWGDTRMIVLVALSASLYAAILIPFKIFKIMGGATEIRPANAIPVVMSLLFGPAGAWGSAMGNLVGDFFGGLGIGDAFGFIGNFLYGYIPYALWRVFFGTTRPQKGSWTHWLGMMFIFLVAGSACAFTVAYGLDVVLGQWPFAILGSMILINNFAMSALLAPPLLFALAPRVEAWSLHWTQVLPESVHRRPRFAWVGVILITVGSLGGLAGGLAISTGMYHQELGFGTWWAALKRVAVLDLARPAPPPPASPPAVEASGSRPVPGGARASTETQAPPEAPAPAPGAHRKGLGLALLPAVILILAGVLLL